VQRNNTPPEPPPQPHSDSQSDTPEGVLMQLFEHINAPAALRANVRKHLYDILRDSVTALEGGHSVQPEDLSKRVLAVLRYLIPLPDSSSPSEDIPTRADYRRECLRRSSAFRRGLLGFHQHFPPLLLQRNPPHQGNQHIPEWLRQLLKPLGTGCYLVVPKAMTDLKRCQGMMLEQTANRCGFTLVRPEDGKRYFSAAARSHGEYRKSWQRLASQWPDVTPEVWVSGDLEDADRPAILLAPIKSPTKNTPVYEKQWRNRVATAARKARIFIPIYPHTVQSDIDWRSIQQLKVIVYGTLTRTHESVLSKRLQIWDQYQETPSFSQVAKVMRLPPTTVKDHFVAACQDIEGQAPTGTTKQRRAGIMRDPGGDFQAHLGSCSRCQNADTADKICPKFLAFVTQETKAELDTRANREQAKLENRGRRKKPTHLHDQIT
jgi:hypothetical protein